MTLVNALVNLQSGILPERLVKPFLRKLDCPLKLLRLDKKFFFRHLHDLPYTREEPASTLLVSFLLELKLQLM